MGAEPPKTQDSSGDSESNSGSDSEKSDASSSSSSGWWECGGGGGGGGGRQAGGEGARKPCFSVTSCDTGLKLKIAAVPRGGASRNLTTEARSHSESDSNPCSKCDSASSSDDNLPLRAVTAAAAAKRLRRRQSAAPADPAAPVAPVATSADEKTSAEKKTRSRKIQPKQTKAEGKSKSGSESGSEEERWQGWKRVRAVCRVQETSAPVTGDVSGSGGCGDGSAPEEARSGGGGQAEASSSSSSSTSSSTSSSSSSDSSSSEAESAAPPPPPTPATTATTKLQEEVPEERLPPPPPAPRASPAPSALQRVDTGDADGSSSEMELPPQLVSAAIQRAAADSSESEYESHGGAAARAHAAPHYASMLLQQFVQQTQLLSHPAVAHTPSVTTGPISIPVAAPAAPPAQSQDPPPPADSSQQEPASPHVKRKRGRPRKLKRDTGEPRLEDKCVTIKDFHAGDPPNVSPDSGILSNHNSPTHERTHSPLKDTLRSRYKEDKAQRQRRSDSSESDRPSMLDRRVRQIKTETPSPIPLKRESDKYEKPKRLDVAALDRMLYATDRVLYPPRRKNRLQNKNTSRTRVRDESLEWADSEAEARANRSVLCEVYAKRKDVSNRLASLAKKSGTRGAWRERRGESEPADDPLDPTWRQIDLNPKYKDILSGYKSDHEVKPYKSCSRLMESGYRSDYGCRSGYRSDHRGDRRSGYRTDHSSRSSVRRRTTKLKKSRSVRDRSYYKNHKHFVTEQEISLLATETLGSLTLRGASSDDESQLFPNLATAGPKFASVSARLPPAASHVDRTLDPFAPAPVFCALGRPRARFVAHNIFNSSCHDKALVHISPKLHIPSPMPANKIAFTHKFGCPPLAVASKSTMSNFKKTISMNNNSLKQTTRNLSPKNIKMLKNANDISPKIIVFEKARNSYIPNKTLSRNVFLNFKKPSPAPSVHLKKRRRTILLAPPKIHLEPVERASRLSLKMESRHRRHRSHHRRSRSLSRSRTLVKSPPLDHKFVQDMDTLVAHFLKWCHIAPAVEKPPVRNTEKPLSDNSKCLKRGSKKRKSDNAELTVLTKRRHKKQGADWQTKPSSTNEHKLPLKKRHYHMNSSGLPSTAAAATVCRESDCSGDTLQPGTENAKTVAAAVATTVVSVECTPQCPATDDELSISKPIGEHSELSKKIYETSEKLKAVHKMVHDLEKSLPRTKESEKNNTKFEMRVSSPKSDSRAGSVSNKSSTPVVTPKKRHRLETDKLILNSSLDHVVESLTRKLEERAAPPAPVEGSEQASTGGAAVAPAPEDTVREADPLKSMSLRTLCKSSLPPAQKSEIMTRKKNRLEGLTSNLVSKINPSTATKMLDTLLNNNIRKSIECRILEKDKVNLDTSVKAIEDKCKSKEQTHTNTRATVIKSPVSKIKLPSEAKKLPKGTDVLVEQTVVVNIDRPTGIFEPSVDLELQIPKSSISLNSVAIDSCEINKSKLKLRSNDTKLSCKTFKPALDVEEDIPLALMSESTEIIISRPKKSDSIASVISDKIQETASGHNLRQSKRNTNTHIDASCEDSTEKKKKKIGNNIIREGKLLLPPKTVQPAVPAEKTVIDTTEKSQSESEQVIEKSSKINSVELTNSSNKRKPKRRKAINRTGFPSIKKKKKKSYALQSTVANIQSDECSTSCDNSAFERVPKEGEATKSFVERTSTKRSIELKVVLNKEECPRRGRLSVISLERLQGKEPSDLEKERTLAVTPAPATVSKWEVLSETDNAPSPALSSICNDPEDSIPLSLLHVKCERPASRASLRCATRLKRKTSALGAAELPLVKRRASASTRRARSACRSEPPSPQRDNSDAENEPLPLDEKEVDVEQSIEKTVINKRRAAASVSRDHSPASGSDRERDRAPARRNPRLRKKFLPAGLFSDYYKHDEPASRLDAAALRQVRESEAPRGLLAPPLYCERWVRRRRVNFTLPYDIWWQHQYSQPVPSWNYKKIRSNVYYDVKPPAEECESVACNCAPHSGCPEDCINRLVYAECAPALCPCGERCRNQRIQRHQWAPGIERFMTDSKGWGVRCAARIAAADFILEYVGEVVSDREFKERMASRYARDTHHYCLHLDGGLVIDGHRMGGEGRFVNHSCRPNCEMQKWTANGTFRMALFALRDIPPGEELTYDYNFSLFNPAEGQVCKCGSEECRGVIGGKSQRITKPSKPAAAAVAGAPAQRAGRPRKPARSKKSSAPQVQQQLLQDLQYPQQPHKVCPLAARERAIVRDRHCFLLRALRKVRKLRERRSPSPQPAPPPPPPQLAAHAAPPAPGHINPLTLPTNLNVLANVNINPSVFLTRLQELRGEGGRRAASGDAHLGRQERLNNVFRDIHRILVQHKETEAGGEEVWRTETERQGAGAECQRLEAVGRAVEAGHYRTVAQFDAELGGLLAALVRQCRHTPAGAAAAALRKKYNGCKVQFGERLRQIVGPAEPLPAAFTHRSKTEEVIMCICGLHLEEGLMVQCGRAGCGVWQHARCMRVVDTSAQHYCHKCHVRPVELEIPLDEYTEDGHRFYLSLMRGELQVRQGDTVYVLRDIPIDERRPDLSLSAPPPAPPAPPPAKRPDRKRSRKKDGECATAEKEVPKHTYKTIGEIPVSELDIFRVERLWKHKETGERFVYGHHYLRPHETFHEPTRKFFPNEVMRVPLYEAVPIDLVMSQCWVMDLNSYCKGRPVDAREEHVYICELRVDRTARLFTKVSRSKYPICTKSYAFRHFPQRLKLSRTYAPHVVSPEYLKGRGRAAAVDKRASSPAPAPPPPPPPPPRTREKQKERLNMIVSRLLGAGGGGGGGDASYLLEPRRARVKPS